jgi:hypothetical protein
MISLDLLEWLRGGAPAKKWYWRKANVRIAINGESSSSYAQLYFSRPDGDLEIFPNELRYLLQALKDGTARVVKVCRIYYA